MYYLYEKNRDGVSDAMFLRFERLLLRLRYNQANFVFLFYLEHTKNARKSTENKHQEAEARRNREQQRSNKKRG